MNGDGFDDLVGRLISNDTGSILYGGDFTGAVTHRASGIGGAVTAGTADADVMVGTAGDDTLVGLGGADVLKGGAGNDRLAVQAGFRRVEGGSGFDTLAYDMAGSLLDLATGPSGRFSGIEAIDLMGGGNTLRVSAQSLLRLSDTANSLAVTGAVGDRVEFTDHGWVITNIVDGVATLRNGQAVLTAPVTMLPANLPTDGPDRLIGGPGAETLGGAGGDDNINGGTGDSLIGGAGDDRISLSSLDVAGVDGGPGQDQLILAGSSMVLDLPSLAGNKLRSIEEISLLGRGNSLRLDADSVLAISDTGTLTVRGGGGDSINFMDTGWRVAAGSDGFTAYVKGTATVLRENSVEARTPALGAADLANPDFALTITGLAAGDQLGIGFRPAGDLNGDGLKDLVITAPGAAGGLGEVYVVFGRADYFAGGINLAAVAAGTGGFMLRGGTIGDIGTVRDLGRSVSAAGDVDGDGIDDLIIGAPRYSSTGSVRLAQGRVDDLGYENLTPGSQPPVIIQTDFGPIEGDVPGPRADTGAVFVLRGKASGFGTAPTLLDLAAGSGGWMIEGQLRDQFFGTTVAGIGDMNGDGRADIAAGGTTGSGVYYSGPGGEPVVGATVILGGALPTMTLDLPVLKLDGKAFTFEVNTTLYGSSHYVRAAGDVNQDGFADLFVLQSGATRLVYGGHLGGSGDVLNSFASFFNSTASDAVGWSAANIGDVNRDGFDDLLFGIPGDDWNGLFTRVDAGGANLFYGRAGGLPVAGYVLERIDLPTYDPNPVKNIMFRGATIGEQAGYRLAGAGDLDGDGYGDFLIGAATGKIYVVFGHGQPGADRGGDRRLRHSGRRRRAAALR
jgi:hypothetical protein